MKKFLFPYFTRGNARQIYAKRVQYKRFHLLVIRNITGFFISFHFIIILFYFFLRQLNAQIKYMRK